MAKPFLILQLRPETEAADDEYAAFLRKGGLMADQTVRIRLDQTPLPADLQLDEFCWCDRGGRSGLRQRYTRKEDANRSAYRSGCFVLDAGNHRA